MAGDIYAVIGWFLAALVGGGAALVLMAVSMWRIYAKLGLPGWAALVPFLDVWVLGERVDGIGLAIGNVAAVACCFVPFVRSIAMPVALATRVMLYSRTVQELGRPGWHADLWVLFPYVYLPVLAFSRD